MMPSSSEILLILVVAFILFGGKQVYEFIRTAGKWVGKLQRASRDFQRELNLEAQDRETPGKPSYRPEPKPERDQDVPSSNLQG